MPPSTSTPSPPTAPARRSDSTSPACPLVKPRESLSSWSNSTIRMGMQPLWRISIARTSPARLTRRRDNSSPMTPTVSAAIYSAADRQSADAGSAGCADDRSRRFPADRRHQALFRGDRPDRRQRRRRHRHHHPGAAAVHLRFHQGAWPPHHRGQRRLQLRRNRFGGERVVVRPEQQSPLGLRHLPLWDRHSNGIG